MMPSSASAVLVSPLSHWQNVSLAGLFHPEKQKQNCLGQDWVNREVWARVSSPYWSKTAEQSVRGGQVRL